MRNTDTIVILTGAGISAESGLQTFRAEDGLWCGHKVEEVATPEGFARNPQKVQQFYNMRRAQLQDVSPNAAHQAIAGLAGRWRGEIVLITQNVDDLHQRAMEGVTPKGNYACYPMHGSLKRVRCTASEEVSEWDSDLSAEHTCLCCNLRGTLRPDIVWFGEMPYFLEEIGAALDRATLFVSIGTSGSVYPAAGFVQQLRLEKRAHLVELNLEPSAGSQYFHERHYGKATEIVPVFFGGM